MVKRLHGLAGAGERLNKGHGREVDTGSRKGTLGQGTTWREKGTLKTLAWRARTGMRW